MDDQLQEAKRWADAFDASRVVPRRHQPLIATAAPAVVGIPAFLLYAFALAMVSAPLDRFSFLGFVAAIPYGLCIAVVAASWPDRVVLTVCASMAWQVLVALYVLVLASLVWRPNSFLPAR